MSKDLRYRLLKDLDIFLDEEKQEKLIDDLTEAFEASPEAAAHRQKHGVDRLIWVEMFLSVAINHYRQGMIAYYNSQDMRTMLYEIIPEIALVQSEHAEEIIQELRAFWQYLRHELQLPNAEKCLKVLNQKNIVERFRQELADPNNWGTAKSVFMPAIEAGVDLTDEQAVQKYVDEYNQKMMQEHEALMNAPVPDAILKKRDEIIEIATNFCKQHLNDEYADLAQKMAEVIARVKPESPFARGRAKSWAAGIVYALGQVNFLFDPGTEPHMRADELCETIGVSQQTASSKAKDIRKGMGLVPFDPNWTLPSQQENNPLLEFLDMMQEMYPDEPPPDNVIPFPGLPPTEPDENDAGDED